MIMFKKKSADFLLLIILLLWPMLGINAVWAAESEMTIPTILSTTQIEENTGNQIMVNGLAAPDDSVEIYINGSYYGVAITKELSLTLAKFSYISPTITSQGPFEVMVISKNRQTHLLSAPVTAQVNSVIEKSLLQSNQPQEIIRPATPATINPPVLLTPTAGNCITDLTISGTSDSGTAINIFIDNKFITSLTTGKSSGPAAFNFSPAVNLDRGQHTVYVVAQDSVNNQSARSKIISFCISSPQIINATSSVAENINSSLGGHLLASSTASSSVFQKTTTKVSFAQRHKGLFNTMIFVVFVIGLLLWMILINRKLENEKNWDNPDNIAKNNQTNNKEVS
jgi:hypothetical protein